jgi:hypothetical protein
MVRNEEEECRLSEYVKLIMFLPAPPSELVKLCSDENWVFPSMEMFEQRLELPGTYFFFYHYFYKATLGDVRWKKEVLSDLPVTERIGTAQEEAFALVQLKNNYYAWLHNAKKQFCPDVATALDEDEVRGLTRADSMEGMFKNQIIDLDDESLEGSGYIRSVKPGDGNEEDDDGVQRLDRRYTAILGASVPETSQSFTAYKEALKQDHTLSSVGVEEMTVDEAKRARKRRRVSAAKGLREYTERQGSEGKFKGWSPRAHSYMNNLVKSMVKDSEADKYKRFHLVYRRLNEEYFAENNKEGEKKEVNPELYENCWDLETMIAV